MFTIFQDICNLDLSLLFLFGKLETVVLKIFANWVILHVFCRLLFFLLLKMNSFKKSFRNTIKMSNRSGPDPRFVGSDLGPNLFVKFTRR